MNTLFFGDCLDIVREQIAVESVDLIYLDPPFNSQRDYNVLFKTPKGHAMDAQITAFEDSWHWGAQAEREFDEILHQSNTQVAELLLALRRFLRENDILAYLTMMARRLLELHRVLKKTGSLYLHCDPTVSHYLKLVLDAVFGMDNFRNEITWLRSRNPNGSQYEAKRFSPDTDIIFCYTESHGVKLKKDLAGAQDLVKRDKHQFQWWACSLVHAQPYQGKKKGADSGIDGLIYFRDDDGLAKKIIVSVKGGENVNVGMVRDLKGVLEREKADIGLFVTLMPPTQPMIKEAVTQNAASDRRGFIAENRAARIPRYESGRRNLQAGQSRKRKKAESIALEGKPS